MLLLAAVAQAQLNVPVPNNSFEDPAQDTAGSGGEPVSWNTNGQAYRPLASEFATVPHGLNLLRLEQGQSASIGIARVSFLAHERVKQ